MVIGVTPAKVPGPPPHYHSQFSEVFLVTEGEMEFVINGEPRIVKAGESVDLAPGTVHTFSNNSEVPCKWINIHSPKGFLSFFEQLGVSASEDDAFRKSIAQERIQKVIQSAPKFDMLITTEALRPNE